MAATASNRGITMTRNVVDDFSFVKVSTNI
nr:MAG TPA: hypothetical protein [Caudoviricetes sp.]